MKIKLYEVKVYEDIEDFVGGDAKTIEEFCIPELLLFINDKHIFIAETKEKMEQRLEGVDGLVEINAPRDIKKYLYALVKNLDENKKLVKTLREQLFDSERIEKLVAALTEK
jgi:hypothetical protein